MQVWRNMRIFPRLASSLLFSFYASSDKNEEKNIEHAYEEICKIMHEAHIDFELVYVSYVGAGV